MIKEHTGITEPQTDPDFVAPHFWIYTVWSLHQALQQAGFDMLMSTHVNYLR